MDYDNKGIIINLTAPQYTKNYIAAFVLIIFILFINNGIYFNNDLYDYPSQHAETASKSHNTITPYYQLFNTTDKLVFVFEMNRHGAKTPDTFPVLSRELFFGSQDSQLTVSGFQMNEVLGRWIGKRYRHYLFNKTYNQDELVIFTSSKQRTFFSAIAWAKGLFPDKRAEPVYHMNKNITYTNRVNDNPPIKNFQLNKTLETVKINIQDPRNDNLFSAWKCKENITSTKAFNEMFNKTSIYNLTKNEIKEAVDEITGKYPFFLNYKLPSDKIYSLQFVNSMSSYIAPVQYEFNNTAFDFTNKTSDFLTRALLEKWYSPRILESQPKRIALSGFFTKMLDFYDSKFNKTNKNDTKFVLFSAHDGNIIDLLTTFIEPQILKNRLKNYKKHFDFLFPPYASSFLFELFETKRGQRYIKILYNGKYITGLSFLYNKRIDGIKFYEFTNFIKSRIDSAYENIYCYRVDQYHRHTSKYSDKEEKFNR